MSQGGFMLFSKPRFSMKHLLVLLYFLALCLLLVLLRRETLGDSPLFSLSQTVSPATSGSAIVSAKGENLRPGLKGITTNSLINEDALVWRQFENTNATEIAVNGNLMLAACAEKGKIVSLRLNDVGAPEQLGSIRLPASIARIEIVGDRAFVGMPRHNGYALLDLKDPEDIKLIARRFETGLVSDLVVKGSSLYYTDIYAGIGRIDMASQNPTAELLVPMDSPWRIDRIGEKLVAGSLKGKLKLYNITMQGSLREVGEITYPGNVRGVAFTEDKLAVVISDGRLFTYQLSSWPKLELASEINVNGSPLRLDRIPGTSKVVANLVSSGLSIFDIGQPGTPVLSGAYKVSQTFRGLSLSPDVAYVATSQGLEALSIDEIENGAASRLASTAIIEQNYYRLREWGGQLIANDGTSVFTIGPSRKKDHFVQDSLPIVDDQSVRLFEQSKEGGFEMKGAPIKVDGAMASEYRGDLLYILHRAGLRILSGKSPETLVPVSELPLPGLPKAFTFSSSGKVLIATRDEGLLIVDVSKPEQPVLLSRLAPLQHLQTVSYAYDVVEKDNLAFVSFGLSGVYVIDIRKPDQPELVQIIATPDAAKKMVLYDGLLIVAVEDYGLFVVDTDSEGGIVPVGSIPSPVRIDELALVNDVLYVSSRPAGTMALPLPRRLPVVDVVDENEVRVDVGQIEIGQYVYLYDDRHAEKVKIAMP